VLAQGELIGTYERAADFRAERHGTEGSQRGYHR
jgi:hypothetical protein